MYNVKVTSGRTTYDIKNLAGGAASVEIRGRGPIHFNDVGKRKLGPNRQTWGVCVTFRGQVWAFRYEGRGALEITYDRSSNSLSLKPENGTVAELTS